MNFEKLYQFLYNKSKYIEYIVVLSTYGNIVLSRTFSTAHLLIDKSGWLVNCQENIHV